MTVHFDHNLNCWIMTTCLCKATMLYSYFYFLKNRDLKMYRAELLPLLIAWEMQSPCLPRQVAQVPASPSLGTSPGSTRSALAICSEMCCISGRQCTAHHGWWPQPLACPCPIPGPLGRCPQQHPGLQCTCWGILSYSWLYGKTKKNLCLFPTLPHESTPS